MALRADDEQPAGGTYLLRFLLDCRLVLGQLVRKQLPGRKNFLVVRVCVARGVRDDLFRKARLCQVRTGQVFRVAPQHDIRTAARHVGGDGNRTVNTGISHNLRLHLMEFGVQYFMPDPLPGQQPAQFLTGFDGDSTYQYRLSLCMSLFHRRYDSFQLLFPGLIYRILMVNTLYRHIRRNLPPRPLP